MTLDRRAQLDLWLVDLVAGEASLFEIGAELGLDVKETGTPRSGAPSARSKAVARVALRAILASHVGLEAARQPFRIAPNGKPSLDTVAAELAVAGAMAGHDVPSFSLAHIDTMAVIGVSQMGPIGVDLEAPRPVRISAARRAQLEAAATLLDPSAPLADAPADRRFLQAWVRLEALAKTTGEGVGGLLGRLEDPHRPLEGTMAEGRQVRVRDVVLPSHLDLIAAVGGIDDALGAASGLPVARTLPLDPGWLADLIAGRVPGGWSHGR